MQKIRKEDEGEFSLYIKFFKRVIDIFVSFFVCLGLIPVCVIVGILIKKEDGGAIFYNAERIGQNGKLFKMYKFRSMKENAPDIRLADGSTYNGADDPRVTKIGKILRETSIDELPQFINVLKGEMSIIGPRPDPPDWLDKYPEDIKIFLSVRPGITGYSQAYFRNDADGEMKMQNDAYYAKNCSALMDLKIIFKTIESVFKHENTYKDTENEKQAVEEAQKLLEEYETK